MFTLIPSYPFVSGRRKSICKKNAGKLLQIWTTSRGLITVYHAAVSGSDSPTISGGYHNVLERAAKKHGEIAKLELNGVIMDWSARFCS